MRHTYIGLILSFILVLSSCSNSSFSDLETQAGSWQILGPVQGSQGAFPPPSVRMSLNSLGNPGVAYYMYSSGPAGFNYYDGTQWLGAGTLYNFGVGYISTTDIDIVFDTLNRPIVAYSQWVGGVGGFINVKRFNASTGIWKTLASLSLGSDYPYRVELELVNNLQPIIAYQTGPGGSTVQVKGWNGSSWIDYGGPEYSYTFSLTLDKTKQPVLAYEKTGAGVGVFVKQWDGTQWIPLGSALNLSTSGSKPPVITTDALGNFVVVWSEYNHIHTTESSYIYAKRWTNGSWQPLGNFVTDNARTYALDLALDSEGNPYVIWQNDIDKAIYVKHWKAAENRWRFIGPNPISNLQGIKTGGSPNVDFRNNTLVATWNRPSVVINGISYNGRILTKRYIP